LPGISPGGAADDPPKATELVEYDKGKDVAIAPGGIAHAG